MDNLNSTSTSNSVSFSNNQSSGYRRLIKNLNRTSTAKLRNIFQIIGKRTNEEEHVEYVLTEEEFLAAINKIFDDEKDFKAEAQKLFKDIDVHRKNIISWEEFLDYLAKYLQSPQKQTVKAGDVEYFTPPHVKRDSIAKIVLLETDNYFCYAIVTIYGRVGLYDGNLDFLTSYSVIMTREDLDRKDRERRRRNRQITDALFLPDVMMFIVVNTTRSMTVYDASGLKHVPVWLILGFPDIIQCMAYKPNEQNRKLYFGTDNGDVQVVHFKKPKEKLFRKKHNDKLTIRFHREIIADKEYTVFKRIGRIHDNLVKIMDCNDKTVISCSYDKRKSIAIIEMDGSRPVHFLKMERGANCFASSEKQKLLLTGSDDGIVKIWSKIATGQPLAKLEASKVGIVDIAILGSRNVFLTIDKDGVLKFWDLIEFVCMQNVSLNFPAFKVLGKDIYWGVRSIYPGSRRSYSAKNLWERPFILITCCNTIAKVNLHFEDSETVSEAAILPPPPLQNSFLVPKDWNIYSKEVSFEETTEEYDKPLTTEKVHLEDLDFILKKNLLEDFGRKVDINHRIAKLESKKLEMQWFVENGAPYLALQLFEIKEVTLNPDLPVPNIKKIRKLVENTQKMLADASSRSIIFSEASSSSRSPRSSRSSVVEFD